jgi:hypothetical protein
MHFKNYLQFQTINRLLQRKCCRIIDPVGGRRGNSLSNKQSAALAATMSNIVMSSS